MKRVMLALLATLFITGTANAATVTYGWEDGGTILGSYGNLVDPLNVSDKVNSGSYALKVTESPHSGTPQAYVGFVTGLTDGDVIDAGFFGYDDTPGASPSLRIWGHYALSGDIDSYEGSASGNYTYTDGTGWSEVSHSWTFDSDGGARDALVIEARLYSTPSTDPNGSTDFWIDDLTITAPDHAGIQTAGTNPVPVPAAFWLLGSGLIGLAGLRRRNV